MAIGTTTRAVLGVAVLAVGALAWRAAVSEAPAGSPDRARHSPSAGAEPPSPVLRGHATADRECAAGARGDDPLEREVYRAFGRVVLGDRQAPLSGVRVQAWLRRGDVVEPLSETRSGEDGRYALDLPELRELPQLVVRAGVLDLRATAPSPTLGAKAHILCLPHVCRPRASEHDFVFHQRTVACGRVVDRNGQPVPRARVESSRNGSLSRPRTTADESGRYVVPIKGPLVRGPFTGEVRIEAEAQGVGAASIGPLPFPSTERRILQVPDLVLEGRGVIAGVAVFPDRTPAAGVEIEYRPFRDRISSLRGPGLVYGRARTDEYGRFRLAGLREGRFSVRPCFYPVGMGMTCMTGTEDVCLEVSSYRVRLRVQDDEGRPLPGTLLGARCTHPSEESLRGPHPVPTADGSVDLWEQRPGARLVFMAQLPGLVVAEGETTIDEGVWSKDVVLTLRPPGDAVGYLRLCPRATDGSAVGPYYVEVISPLAEVAVRDLMPAHVGEDGLVGPIPVGTWKLWMEALPDEEGRRACWFDATTVATVCRGEVADVDIELRVGGRVRVRVPSVTDDADDDPAVGLTYASDPETREGLRPGWDEWKTSEVLKPGFWAMNVEAEGFLPQSHPVIVYAGAVTEVEVELRPKPR